MGSWEELTYMTGFNNEFKSEHPSYLGSVPLGQNTPQKCKYGLYAEQLSGTAFTVANSHNKRTWMYRIRPSVCHSPLKPIDDCYDFQRQKPTRTVPCQMRWKPFGLESTERKVDFVEGLKVICGAGDAKTRHGLSVYVYTCNSSMNNKCFSSADGDMLIVPQQGRLYIISELGRLAVKPNEIGLIPQGLKFKVDVDESRDDNTSPVMTRGYICEVFGDHFQLPERGAIGANGLANARDFLHPVAWFEDKEEDHIDYSWVLKYQGDAFMSQLDHSPFDVVGWHGNYVPFKYDLENFCTVNSVSFDHLDPSIFTVLTCPSGKPGVALLDFVIFPPRWSVADNTFRPPYYHRNCMSEFMGLIRGKYEAKEEGFGPGGATLHQIMTPHGPDASCFDEWSTKELTPIRVAEGTQAFMFETYLGLSVTDWAMNHSGKLDSEYTKCWLDIKKNFPGY